jgi:hypothetical protein
MIWFFFIDYTRTSEHSTQNSNKQVCVKNSLILSEYWYDDYAIKIALIYDASFSSRLLSAFLFFFYLFLWYCYCLADNVLFLHQLIAPSSKLLLWLLHLRCRHCSISVFYLIYRILPIQRVLYKSKNIIDDDSHISIKKRKRERVVGADEGRMINVFIEKSVFFLLLLSSLVIIIIIIFLLLRFPTFIIICANKDMRMLQVIKFFFFASFWEEKFSPFWCNYRTRCFVNYVSKDSNYSDRKKDCISMMMCRFQGKRFFFSLLTIYM